MAENSDREIEIRTLSGESIAVHFPFTRTVQDLKLLLHQIFSPATNSPNFHLFFKVLSLSLSHPKSFRSSRLHQFHTFLFCNFRILLLHFLCHVDVFQGSKLRLQNQIGCYPIEPGEFLVLVPFTKKSNQCEASAAPLNDVDTASILNLADSTWSNIMEDLSYLRETESDKLKDDDASHFKFSTFNDELEKKKMVDTTGTNCSEAKPQRDFGSEKQIELPYHHILNIMQHTDEDALGEHNCEVLFKVLESINCLSDLPFGHCKLFKRARLKGGGLESYGNNGSSCLCPPWLKIVMKAFTFINIFSAFLHLQCKKTTANLLEDALNQLAKFEVKLDFQDMKQLSLLCPEVN